MSNEPHTKAPFLQVGPHNNGPAVVVTAYVLVITAILTTLTRVIIARASGRTLTIADGLNIAATLLALPQSIAINLAVNHGLGRHLDNVSASNQASYYKALYAANILAAAAATCAKSSIIQLVRLLEPHRNWKLRIVITLSVAFWTLFSILSLALQCGLPRPWIYTPQRCNSGGFVYAIVGLDVATDLYLAIFFIPTIWGLHISKSTRVVVASLFLSRLLVCFSSVIEMVFLPAALSSPDQTWTQTGAVIAGQFSMNLSIITTNLPALKRFLYNLQSGQSGTRLGDRQANLELSNSSSSWHRSTIENSRNSAGPRGHRLPSFHSSQRSRKKHLDSRSEGTGSEDGILRVVDVTVDWQKRSKF